MAIAVEIPAEIESALRSQLGAALENHARGELAAAWFAEGRVSSREVARILGVSLFEAHAFLKQRQAWAPILIEEVEDDLATIERNRTK